MPTTRSYTTNSTPAIRWLLWCLVGWALGISSQARADEAELQKAEAGAVAAILAAHEAKDQCTLKRLAAERWRGPWWLTDRLLSAGHTKAAARYAEFVRDEDGDALRRHVSARLEDRQPTWRAIAEARTLLDEGAVAAALARLDDLGTGADTVGTLRALELRAEALDIEERAEEADACLQRACRIAARLGWDQMADWRAVEERIGQLIEHEDWHALLPLCSRLLTLNRCRGKPRAVGRSHANVGGAYLELGRPDEALPHVLRAMRLLAARPGPGAGGHEAAQQAYDVAVVEMMLAQACERNSEYARALAHGERARGVFAGLKANAELACSCQALGNTYAALANFEHALAAYTCGLEALAPAGAEAAEARLGLRVNVGLALHELGRPEDAQEVLAAVHEALGEVPTRRLRVHTLLNLGVVAESAEDWERAAALYCRARSEVHDDPELEAWLAIRQGDVRSRGGRATQAECRGAARAHYAEALVQGEKWKLANVRMLAHVGLGETALALGDFPASAQHAASAIRILEGGLHDLAASEVVRARSHRARIFALGVRAAAATENPSAVFSFMERARARLLLDALGGRNRLHRHALDRGLVRAEAQARARYTHALQAYREAQSRSPKRIGREREEAVERARAELLEMTRRIERASRRVSDASGLKGVTLDEAVAGCPPGEALVLFTLLPRRSYALVVTRGKARIVELSGTERLAPLCGALLTTDPDEPVTDLPERIAALRSALLEPLALPEDTKRLFVCPDGVLATLAWDALLDDSTRKRMEVALVPSATVHHALRASIPRRGKQRLLLGDPDYRGHEGSASKVVYVHGRPLADLPASRREVGAIARVGDLQLLAEEAGEARLRTALNRAERLQAVHLACHGLVDAAQPFLSALALVPDAEEDGFLTALEIFSLRVNTDLVVLSACETGRGRHMHGEGLVGLTGAFLGAGAPRVIASLWQVEDEATRKLMVRFYEEWVRPGVSTAAALRRAQQHVRASHPHPYYWAGWVLWGRPE